MFGRSEARVGADGVDGLPDGGGAVFPRQAPGAPALDGRIVTFAQLYLLARPGSRINVTCAHEVFSTFADRRGSGRMQRKSFEVALAQVARGAGGGLAGDCVTHLCWRENSARLFPAGAEPAILLSAHEVEMAARRRAVAAGPDPVLAFLDERLVEAHGMVASLEAVKTACAADSLPFREVLAGAKARGAMLRKNVWGPDFLTDCRLVAPAEVA